MQALIGAAKQALAQGARGYAAAAAQPTRKVAVLGAAGGIGQPLGLLMKVCCGGCFSWVWLMKASGIVQACVLFQRCVKGAAAADQPLGHRPLALRYRGHAGRCSGHQPHQLQGEDQGAQSSCRQQQQQATAPDQGALRRVGLRRPRAAGRGAAGLRPGHHPRWRASQAGHDARRPVQGVLAARQMGASRLVTARLTCAHVLQVNASIVRDLIKACGQHCPEARDSVSGCTQLALCSHAWITCAGDAQHHLKSSQLHGANSGRGAEGDGRVQQEQAVRSDHPRCGTARAAILLSPVRQHSPAC